MNSLKKLTFIILIFILNGCGVPQSDVDELNKKIETLTKEIDECKYGADKLLRKANLYYKDQDFDKSKLEIKTIIDRYPASDEAHEAKKLLASVDSEIKKIEEAKKKEEIKKQKEMKKKFANATRNMSKNYDDINEITWYRDKTSPRYTNYNGFFGYFGKPDTGSPYLRLRIQYAADDWLFIEKYIIKVDGVNYEIQEEKYGEIESDNGGGKIWEWLDRGVSKNELEIMKAVSNGKKVKIRFVGRQYHSDKTITSAQKKALRNVINAFEAAGGKVY